MSDWGAQHSGVATALSGMDMAMPSGDGLWGKQLIEAVKNGSVPESRVTDMATRYLREPSRPVSLGYVSNLCAES